MKHSLALLKNLVLGLLLIAGAAAVLLYSDLGSRRQANADEAGGARPLRVALVQHASIGPLDEGRKGLLAALEARGYADGDRLIIRSYNPEADISTANAIAKEVTSGDFDLIISISTVSLQTVANANRFSTPPRRHVFGLTSDPYGAGVGVSRDNHLEHPPYMTGLGSMPPVQEAFRLAKEIHPQLKRVGLVWNSAESNSVAATNLAKAACAELGITLVDANAENSTSVAEATASVLSRGVDAIWVSPDVTVVVAVDAVLAAAKRARVPVFTSLPGNAAKGALFDLGADYFGIGSAQGQLAADVLDGKDPATIPVENLMPVKLEVNRLALAGLRDRWELPDSVVDRADAVIDESGRHVKAAPTTPVAAGSLPGGSAGNRPLARKMTVDLVEYMDTPNAELARGGVMAGLARSGLVLGKDFDVRRHTAQGDIATLSSIIDAAITQRTDLMLTVSTPSLQNALARGRGTPTVFTMVSSPFLVKAGTSDTDHLPFVTGAYLEAPDKEALDVVRQLLPKARRIGTLYTPAEINSVFNKERLETAAKAAGFEFVAVGIATSSEVSDAALALSGSKLDVVIQIADNLISASFPALMAAANRARLPVITYSPGAADMGTIVVVGRDYFESGVDSGLMAARVLRGERPADIPFVATQKIDYIVNLKVAQAFGITMPAALVAKATKVIR